MAVSNIDGATSASGPISHGLPIRKKLLSIRSSGEERKLVECGAREVHSSLVDFFPSTLAAAKDYGAGGWDRKAELAFSRDI
jgi:hypothetical protein